MAGVLFESRSSFLGIVWILFQLIVYVSSKQSPYVTVDVEPLSSTSICVSWTKFSLKDVKGWQLTVSTPRRTVHIEYNLGPSKSHQLVSKLTSNTSYTISLHSFNKNGLVTTWTIPALFVNTPYHNLTSRGQKNQGRLLGKCGHASVTSKKTTVSLPPKLGKSTEMEHVHFNDTNNVLNYTANEWGDEGKESKSSWDKIGRLVLIVGGSGFAGIALISLGVAAYCRMDRAKIAEVERKKSVAELPNRTDPEGKNESTELVEKPTAATAEPTMRNDNLLDVANADRDQNVCSVVSWGSEFDVLENSEDHSSKTNYGTQPWKQMSLHGTAGHTSHPGTTSSVKSHQSLRHQHSVPTIRYNPSSPQCMATSQSHNTFDYSVPVVNINSYVPSPPSCGQLSGQPNYSNVPNSCDTGNYSNVSALGISQPSTENVYSNVRDLVNARDDGPPPLVPRRF